MRFRKQNSNRTHDMTYQASFFENALNSTVYLDIIEMRNTWMLPVLNATLNKTCEH